MHSSTRMRTFTAEDRVVAFPLGGIGTGNVSLGARGDLRDWEIFNHPGKGTLMPNTFFAIHAQAGDRPAVARVLEGPVQPPHDLSHGYHPATAAGLPRLSGAAFRGEYPFAWIDFTDPVLPVEVQLEAFTPFVPLDPEASGLPCAVFTYTVRNSGSEPVTLTIAGSLANGVGEIDVDRFGNPTAGDIGMNRNEFREEDGLRGMYLTSEQYDAKSLKYGNMSLVTRHPHVTVKPTWLRGAWFDSLQDFWDDFASDGKLTDPGYADPSPMGQTDTCTLGLLDTLAPGETHSYRFVLTWFFPNRTNSWDNNPSAPVVRNNYARHFSDSWDVARYLTDRLTLLEGQTRQFHASLFNSTLPAEVLDAVSANIVPLRSTTCFWLEDGRFFGFEGCFDAAGCCEGNCTHVWSYAQTPAYLFPSLEREMRRIEFVVETSETGYMAFRSFQILGTTFVWGLGDQDPEPASDGQMGSILRVYREWLLSGDRTWLESVWPGVKRAIAFAASHWDKDRDNVLDGRQHNTYDIEFYGPNPLSQIYYLAALRAVGKLAAVMGEPDLERRAAQAFAEGSVRTTELLWNGEYFQQHLEDIDAFKYQHGAGCLADQLLGQLYATMLDLGHLLPQAAVNRAIHAIFSHNFKRDFRDHVNCQRTYVLNDEAGLLLCTWPNGGRPRFPFVYSDEVWTGIEYQVAAHLIYEGWLAEGLELVRTVRARHDGRRRNPWDEVECGHHYARSMSSWALILALSGFTWDASNGVLAFSPACNETDFRCFFSAGLAWGTFAQRIDRGRLVAEIVVDHGQLPLRQLRLSTDTQVTGIDAMLNDTALQLEQQHSDGKLLVTFGTTINLKPGDKLSISISPVRDRDGLV